MELELVCRCRDCALWKQLSRVAKGAGLQPLTASGALFVLRFCQHFLEFWVWSILAGFSGSVG